MIARKEIISDDNYEIVGQDVKDNIDGLLVVINKLRAAYGKPMLVTSGFRTMEDHLRIYAEKGITDKKLIPMKSKHLYGQAVDISDKDGFIKQWVVNNLEFIEKIGLWMEDFNATKNWVHFQIVPPKSGNRFFIP
jgi:hypothetical protein